MEATAPVDLLVAAILGIALLRGLFLGLIREAFSIGALAAAVVAVRLFNAEASALLEGFASEWLPAAAIPYASGALLGLVVLFGVGFAGSVIRKGARAIGLGWADRIGGGALGLAEGAIASGVLLLALGGFLGRDHAFLDGSRSVAFLEQLRGSASGPSDVAAPPRR